MAIGVSQRNLVEASVLFFIICMASELRTRVASGNVIAVLTGTGLPDAAGTSPSSPIWVASPATAAATCSTLFT